MDALLTVVGLAVLAAWAVLWVVTSAALMSVEPERTRKTPPERFGGLHRPVPRRP